MKVDGISAITLILIASIGTDQITRFVLSLLARFQAFEKRFPDPETMLPGPERLKAAKDCKVAYRIIAGLVGGVGIAGLGGFHLLEALGPDYAALISAYQELGKDTTILGLQGDTSRHLLDILVTGLVFMVGAEKSSQLLQMVGVDLKSDSPVEITGTLMLDPDAGTATPSKE